MRRKLFAFIAIVCLAGCNPFNEPSPITENIEGNTFANEYFRFTVEKPEGWYAQSAKETIFSQHKGKKLLAEGDKEREQMIEKSMDSTLPLFGFFEFRHGSQARLNPSVLSIAQNMEHFPEARTGCDYLNHVKAILVTGEIPYIFENECKKINQGGREFAYLNTYAMVSDQKVYQRYYATIEGSHAISIIETYFDEKTEKQVESVIKSIHFK